MVLDHAYVLRSYDIGMCRIGIDGFLLKRFYESAELFVETNSISNFL